MSLFEFVSVAVSIILSLGIVRLLEGLRSTLDSNKRYWPHAAWVGTLLLNHSALWWTLWSFREPATWNYASFVWILLSPGMLYLLATGLVTTSPGIVSSWKDHYFRVRRWFFAVNLLLVVHSAIAVSVLAGVPVSHPFNFALLIPFIFSVIGIASADERVHGAIACVALLNQIVGFGVFLFRPGSLAAA